MLGLKCTLTTWVCTPPLRSDPADRLLFPALDLGAAGDEQCASELAYLSPLAGQPDSVLDRWVLKKALAYIPGWAEERSPEPTPRLPS